MSININELLSLFLNSQNKSNQASTNPSSYNYPPEVFSQSEQEEIPTANNLSDKLFSLLTGENNPLISSLLGVNNPLSNILNNKKGEEHRPSPKDEILL